MRGHSTSELFSWKPLPPLNVPRADCIAIALEDGRVLVTAGKSWTWRASQGWIARKQVPTEVLDARRTQWRIAKSLVGSDGLLRRCRGLVWDTTKNQWITIERLPTIPPPSVLTLGDGTRVRAGGGESAAHNRVRIQVPNGEVLSSRLRIARIAGALTPMGNGKVLVSGGYRVELYFPDRERLIPVAEAEMIDVRTAKVSSAGTMLKARLHHATVVLPNGVVIVLGGSDEDHPCLADAEMAKVTPDVPIRRKKRSL